MIIVIFSNEYIGMYVSSVIAENNIFVHQNFSKKSGDCVEQSGGREISEKGKKNGKSSDKSRDMGLCQTQEES